MTGPLDTAGPPLVEVAALVEAARRARETALGEALGLALLDRLGHRPLKAPELPAGLARSRLALFLARRRAPCPEPALLVELPSSERADLLRRLLACLSPARPAAPWSRHV